MKKIIYALLVTFCSVITLKSQNVLLNPNGNGGFESAVTFAGNNWVQTGTTQPNQWALGNAPTAITGTRAAYLTSDFANANPQAILVQQAAASVVHLYTTINIPATDSAIQFGYKWKSNFFSSIGNYFRVAWDTSSTLFSSTNTVPGFAITSSVTGTGGSWVNFYTDLPPFLAGKQVRLIFTSNLPATFTNNASIYGPVVDSVSLVTYSSGSQIIANTGAQTWNNPASWNLNRMPNYYDDVLIPAGSVMNFTANNNLYVKSVTVNGELINDNAINNLTITRDLIVSGVGSKFDMHALSTVVRSIFIGGNVQVTGDGSTQMFTRYTNLYFNNAQGVSQSLTYNNSNAQFSFEGLNGIFVQNPSGVTINGGTGSLRVIQTVDLAGPLTSSPAILIGDFVTGNATVAIRTNGSFTNAPNFVSNIALNLQYLHSTTINNPLIVGSRNELPASRILNTLVIGNVNATIRVTDDIEIRGSGANALNLFGKVFVNAGKKIFLSTLNAAANAVNNGHVEGAIEYTATTNNQNLTFPVGWGNARRAVVLRNTTGTNVKVLVETVAANGGTGGTGIGTLSNKYRWRVAVTSGTITIPQVDFNINVQDDGLLNGDEAERRITSSATINGTYANITDGTPTGTVLTTVTGSYNTTAFYALAKANGGFAKTWTGGANTLNWNDAANWSDNTVPTCNDEVTLAAGNNIIALPIGGMANCASLSIGQFTRVRVDAGTQLNVGCNQVNGGNKVLDAGLGTLEVLNGGIVNIHGALYVPSGSFLSQTGGIINIDPLGNTDTLKTAAFRIGTLATPVSSSNTFVTGGTIIIKDPNGYNAIEYYGSVTHSWGENHTLQFGVNNSNSYDLPNINGFTSNLTAAGTGTLILGNVAFDGGSGVGRWYLNGNIFAKGNVDIRANADYRSGSTLVVKNNLTVGANARAHFRGPVVLADPINNGSYVAAANSTINIQGKAFTIYPLLNITNGGTGYQRGDVLTLQTSNVVSPTTYIVRSVDANGTVLLVSPYHIGEFTNGSDPTGPFTFTGGSGTGFTADFVKGLTNQFINVGDINTLVVHNNTVTLPQPLKVAQSLTINADVNTINGDVILGHASSITGAARTGSLSVTGNAKINGSFTRAILGVTSSPQLGFFPIGDAAARMDAQITYTTAPTTTGYLKAEFINTAPTTIGTLPTENSVTLVSVANNGYWRFTPLEGLTGGLFNMYVKANGFTGLNNNPQNRLLRRVNNTSSWLLTGTHQAASTDTIRRSALNEWGEFAVGIADNTPVPITLINLRATHKNGYNVISWETVNEINSFGFDVEFSTNGLTYSKVGTVLSMATNGSSNDKLSYQYNHLQQPKGFYRLKLMDKDGRYKYSSVLKLNDVVVLTAEVYPTITNSNVTVQITSEKNTTATIYVIDVNGRILSSKLTQVFAGTSTTNLSLQQYANGTYFIKVEVDNAKSTQLNKVVKY